MNSTIENTRLWSASLGSNDADREVQRKKERLRSCLQLFRDHVGVLTSRISAEFPQLTVHDLTHLDALWETAALIAGDQYPLNPMEAFVLGGAILLHDAAHCFEVYKGGRSAVRSSLPWKDVFASERNLHPDQTIESAEQYSDFAAVRLLHARQAEILGEYEWTSENGGPSFFLIEDVELRSRYGAVIGKIAASHNWSIEDVKSKLRDQINAPGGWPTEWRVDPIKIACLLRCADAAHLDDRRAPDFLFALLKRSGVSLNHWKSQNWLARVDADQSDPGHSSLLFTSTRAFGASDADAWWVAYDAVSVLDAEIQASNNLLLSRVQRESNSPAFQMKRVTGANSPAELRKYIETDGWIPTSAKIHVGNLEGLIGTLGGQSLYGGGDNFAVVIRELIQNARDAVAARRSLFQDYNGRILVRVTKKSATQTYVEIRDDGVGMSEKTMTSALLDFGTSFWASDLARAEFPGLRSSSFRPVGKFGIGFYAVFMVASEVIIASRRFDDGRADVTRLHFPKGLTLRPVLSKGADETYDMTWSTSVRLTIDEPIDDVEVRLLNKGQPQNELSVPLKSYLAALTTGLDVPVTLQIESGPSMSAHESIVSLDTPERRLAWLSDIALLNVPGAKAGVNSKNYVLGNAERLRKMEHDGRIVGLAALLDAPGEQLQFLTTDTIGGLTSQVFRGAAGYLGYMECYPQSAKRDAGKKVAPPELLQSWANEQIVLLRARNSTPVQLHWAAASMANLEIDPIDVINFPALVQNNQWALLTFDEIFTQLQKAPLACLKSRQSEFADLNTQPVVIDGLVTIRPLTHGNLIRLQIDGNRPKFDISLIGCLDRLVRRKGRELIYEVKPLPLVSMFGPTDALIMKLKD